MPEHKSYTSRSAKKPTKHKQTFFHRPNLLMPEITVTSTKPAFPKPGECIIAIGQHPQAGKKQKAIYYIFDSAGLLDLLRLARAGQHILGDDVKVRKGILTKLYEPETAQAIIDTILDRIREVVQKAKMDYLIKPRAQWIGRHPSVETQPDVKIETDEKPERPLRPAAPVPVDDPDFDILADARQGKIKYPAHRDNAKKKRERREQK